MTHIARPGVAVVEPAPPPTFRCCDVPVTAVDRDGAVQLLLSLVARGRGADVHLCNAYTLSLALRDPAMTTLLGRAACNLADGFPVAWAGRRAGQEVMTTRVYGPDLFLDTVARGLPLGLRHYLYGSTPETVALLARRLAEKFPGVQLAGVESPPFREATRDELDDLALRVAATRADLVWVGLGTPRQDVFMGRHAALLGVPLVGVGAAFDFVAGVKPMAPALLQDHGLEWAYRLATEPRRLWRRYLIGNTVFAAGLARDLLTGAART